MHFTTFKYFLTCGASRIPSYDLVALFHLHLSKTFKGRVTTVRTLRYECRKVKIGCLPGHGDMLNFKLNFCLA